MKKDKKPRDCRLGAVGGQAVLEGVMMRSKSNCATAVRVTETGKIVRKKLQVKSVMQTKTLSKIPILRGVVNFVETMKLSFSILTFSAEAQGLEEETRFEKWLAKTFGKSLAAFAAMVGVVLGVALSVGLFIWLPKFVSDLIVSREVSVFLNALLQGGIRILIFISYIFLTGLMPDIRRTYEYHGAESKSIFCYEKHLDLTVENVKKQRRFHPRCGTSFFFVMMILGIFISIFLNFIPLDAAVLGAFGANLIYTLLKLLTIPVVVGVGYEIIRYAGLHDNGLVRVLTAPGLWMQRLTTREPKDDEIEVALVALKSALEHEFSDEDLVAHLPPEEREEQLKSILGTTGVKTEETAEESAPVDDPDQSGM